MKIKLLHKNKGIIKVEFHKFRDGLIDDDWEIDVSHEDNMFHNYYDSLAFKSTYIGPIRNI